MHARERLYACSCTTRVCAHARVHTHVYACMYMHAWRVCACTFRSYPVLVPLSFHFSPSVSLLFSSPLREFCIPHRNDVCVHAARTHVHACSSTCMHTHTRNCAVKRCANLLRREGGHAVLCLHDAVCIYYARHEAARHCTVLCSVALVSA
jgi:hypothetical protein